MTRRVVLAAASGFAASHTMSSSASPTQAQTTSIRSNTMTTTPSGDDKAALARMIVVWKTPKDTAAFDRHYFGVHVPLAKKLPGIRKYEVSVGPTALLGSAADTYLVAILHFDSLAAIRSAFATPEGQECAADRRKLADDDGFQTFLFDSKEV
jgi:uncharacterized protein (TIGR02118 family)